jgi:lipopolysaccharide export system protein LptC
MRRADNRYSRFVAWAKIVLPLAALGLLSTLVLFSSGGGERGEPSIPYAEVEGLAREQGIGAPTYSGVTDDGASIIVSAEKARPNLDRPAEATASGLNAQLDLPDGNRVDMSAQSGAVDTEKGQVELHDDVVIVTSSGYRIETQRLATRTDRTQVTAPDGITATGPLGRLDAGSMSLTQTPEDGGDYVLLFQNGVKLVYEPK